MNNNAYQLDNSQVAIDVLVDIERNLKKDLLDPYLKWGERLELNEAIRNINERIEWILNGSKK